GQQQESAPQIPVGYARQSDPGLAYRIAELVGTEQSSRRTRLPGQDGAEPATDLTEGTEPVTPGQRQKPPIGLTQPVRSGLVLPEKDGRKRRIRQAICADQRPRYRASEGGHSPEKIRQCFTRQSGLWNREQVPCRV